MPSLALAPVSGRYLSLAEREEIAILNVQKLGVREIARRIGRSPSTISRELRRNASTRSNELSYRAMTAQWHAERRASRPKVSKLAADDQLRDYVQDRLAGTIARPDGELVPGPEVRFIGRRHGRRADRRWAKSWSPEQISNRLRVDFPDDESMRISHEAIYQALYIQGRGALKRELVACLRTGRALRVPRARTRGRGKKFVTPEIMISERPAEAADRAVPGHWEGDLILGLESSAIGTLVERTTRFTLLLHLPRMAGHGVELSVKNGPALAGHGAEAVRDAVAEVITGLPEQLRRSLTWDQGAEMAQHVQLHVDTGLDIYFCDPQSPWQRGTNENTNGLLRQYFPKGTDLSRHSRGAMARPRASAGLARSRRARHRRAPDCSTSQVVAAGVRLLYVTEDVPTRDRVHGDGSSMIPYEVLRHLPPDVEVDLLTYRGSAEVPREVSDRCRTVLTLPRRPRNSAVLRSVVSRHSIGAWERRSREASAVVRRMSVAADATLLHGPHVAGLAHTVEGPLVLQVVDPWSRRVVMEAGLVHGPRARYRRLKAAGARLLEAQLPKHARLLTVGRHDAVGWGDLLGRPVRAIPNGVDMGEPVSRVHALGHHPTVCFVGSLGYGPNIVSAQRLVGEVAPRVWARLPSTRFVLAGRQPDPSVLALAGERVVVLADVPSVLDVFAQSDVACFPDQGGLGIRNSVTEALAAGLPVVATPEAAREQPSHPLLRIVAEVDDLVALVLELLANPPAPPHTAPVMRTWKDVALDYLEECSAAVTAHRSPGAP
jgi:IS30 family transposase/glycosyltransferase involved in cell wall biosynthesis